MTNLNDTQRTILAAAGARDSDVVLPFPKSLKLSATKVASTVQSMIESGLILERSLADGETIWRTDDELGKLTIVATAEGLRSVGIEPDQAAEDPAPTNKASRKASSKPGTARSTKKPSKAPSPSRPVKSNPARPSKTGPGPTTKLGMLITALRAKKGATIEDLTGATGWQAHSVRGAISGALKKKQGLNITSTPVEGRGRVYRIAE